MNYDVMIQKPEKMSFAGDSSEEKVGFYFLDDK